MQDRLQWEIYISIFRNRYIMRGLGLVLGVPFGLLIVFILILSKGDVIGTDAKYALLLIGALLVLTVIVVLLVYGGRYAPGFIVDADGVTNYTQAQQFKRNKLIHNLLITFGLFSGNLSAAGAGLLANSRQVMKLKWKHIRKVQLDPKRHTILLRGGFTEKITVFCTPDNYADVEAMVSRKINTR